MDKIKIPIGEMVWVGYNDREGHLIYILTSKKDRTWYYLYEYEEGEWKRTGKEKDPDTLVRKYKVLDKIRCS